MLVIDLSDAPPAQLVSRLTTAVRADPGNPDPQHALAALLAHLGESAKAAALYERLADRHPTAAERLLALAVEAGDVAAAEAILPRAFATAGSDAGWVTRFCLWQEAVADLAWRHGDRPGCFALLSGLAARHGAYFRAMRPDRRRQAVQAALAAPDPEPPADGATPLLLAVVLWGAPFAALFLDQLLPTLLAPGNLPAVAADRPVMLMLWTDPATATLLEAAPALAPVRALASVSVERFDAGLLDGLADPAIDPGLRTAKKLRIVAAGHEVALGRAARHGWAFAALYPDWVLSERCLAVLMATLDAGSDIVMMAGLPAAQEGFAADAAAAGRDGSGRWPATDLARTAVRHRHPALAGFIVRDDQVRSVQRPDLLLWPVGTDGLVLRSLHWHVAAVAGRAAAGWRGDPVHGLDHRLLDALVAGGDPAVRFIEDVAEAAVVGLNPAAAGVPAGTPSLWTPDRLARALAPDALPQAPSRRAIAGLGRALVVPPSSGTGPDRTRVLEAVCHRSAAFTAALLARQGQFAFG